MASEHTDVQKGRSLERLLQLKRLERPSAETMEQIERGFRQRQIAISVPRRHWWHSLPRVRRALVSVGGLATAAAAVVAMLLPAARQTVHSPAPSAPVSMLDETVVYAPVQRERASPVQVARADEVIPEMESAFVIDELVRPASSETRFTTLAAPETLSATRTEEYAVYTFVADADAGRF